MCILLRILSLLLLHSYYLITSYEIEADMAEFRAFDQETPQWKEWWRFMDENMPSAFQVKMLGTKKFKPINDMNPDERFNHTLELLTSVDICIHSRITVCDFDSNVSRFIKLAHDDFNSVYDINGIEGQINLDSIICLGFPFNSPHQQI